jgi:hypothetical protein
MLIRDQIVCFMTNSLFPKTVFRQLSRVLVGFLNQTICTFENALCETALRPSLIIFFPVWCVVVDVPNIQQILVKHSIITVI